MFHPYRADPTHGTHNYVYGCHLSRWDQVLGVVDDPHKHEGGPKSPGTLIARSDVSERKQEKPSFAQYSENHVHLTHFDLCRL